MLAAWPYFVSGISLTYVVDMNIKYELELMSLFSDPDLK